MYWFRIYFMTHQVLALVSCCCHFSLYSWIISYHNIQTQLFWLEKGLCAVETSSPCPCEDSYPTERAIDMDLLGGGAWEQHRSCHKELSWLATFGGMWHDFFPRAAHQQMEEVCEPYCSRQCPCSCDFDHQVKHCDQDCSPWCFGPCCPGFLSAGAKTWFIYNLFDIFCNFQSES